MDGSGVARIKVDPYLDHFASGSAEIMPLEIGSPLPRLLRLHLVTPWLDGWLRMASAAKARGARSMLAALATAVAARKLRRLGIDPSAGMIILLIEIRIA